MKECLYNTASYSLLTIEEFNGANGKFKHLNLILSG